MRSDWRPREPLKRLRTQIAYDDRRIYFRFRWDQPDPGGWLHDALVYLVGDHDRARAVRNAEVTMWELYEKDPASFVR
ncbi:hypothetical protein [Natrarchaeobius oligotrophus]|uniref:hypothetical protein n=1 Tax=Natrarchaeobius oligotrophus TaxID=3455743 RepID=UPI001AA00B11|nr:hypothetical protein [Natrarchaeobius chitinivorans]